MGYIGKPSRIGGWGIRGNGGVGTSCIICIESATMGPNMPISRPKIHCQPLPTPSLVNRRRRVERLLSLGVRDIQLRIKGADPDELDAEVARAERACRAAGGRLWVNDFWRAAIKHRTYGVHLGQEDLHAASGDVLREISEAGLRLGVSTHSYLELARALAVRPSYISLGPVFETRSKNVAFSPRGAGLVRVWRALVDVPLVAIGGISVETAPEVGLVGVNC